MAHILIDWLNHDVELSKKIGEIFHRNLLIIILFDRVDK